MNFQHHNQHMKNRAIVRGDPKALRFRPTIWNLFSDKGFIISHCCNNECKLDEISNKIPVSLSDEEKKAIDKGLDDLKNGRVLSGEQVKERMRNKYPNLIK